MSIRKEVRGRLDCDVGQWPNKWKLFSEEMPDRHVDIDKALQEFYGKTVKIVIEEVTVC